MNGSTDVGESPFSPDGYNAEAVSLIILGVCGGIATIIYSLRRLKECNCNFAKLCCVNSECKDEKKNIV
jgi:hypothetical protein